MTYPYLPSYRMPRACGCLIALMTVGFIIGTVVILFGLPLVFTTIADRVNPVPVFDLRLDEHFSLTDTDIHLLHIGEDTRCGIGESVCAGTVDITVQVETAGKEGETHTLVFSVTEASSGLVLLPNGYFLRVIRVSPDTIPGVASDYIIRFQAFTAEP